MRLHPAALGLAQRARLQEDPVRDPDLADIVKEEAVCRALVTYHRLADGLGKSGGVPLDALRVGARARVLRLQRAREGRDRLEVGALQQLALAALDLEHVSQVPRVEQQLLFGPSTVFLRRAERNAGQTAGQPFGNGKQFERAERLAHEGVGSSSLRCLGAALRAGQEDDRDVAGRRRRLQLGTELEPGRSRHVDVEDDHVRPGSTDLPARSDGILGFDHGDVGDLERRPQQGAKRRIVVYQQDPQRAVPPFPEPVCSCRHVARRT